MTSYSTDYGTCSNATDVAVWVQYGNYTTGGTDCGVVYYSAPSDSAQTGLGSYQHGWGNYQVVWNVTQAWPAETAAEKAEREAREAAAEAERAVAAKRAEELLLLLLTPEQKKQYAELGYFDTVVNDATYRIKRGRSGNVVRLEGGEERFKYCAHPDEWVPDEDTMAAQLLMLRNDEAGFLAVANRTEVARRDDLQRVMDVLDAL